jgi:hypothetical protein
VDQLLQLAASLQKRLSSTQAAIVLALVVAGLIAIQLAAVQSAFPYFIVVAVLLVFVVAALLFLHSLDRSVSLGGLTEDERAAVRSSLLTARNQVAVQLGCDKARCRANIFGQNKIGRLQIIKDLTINMEHVEEWDISMPPGRGSTGIAWTTRRPKVVIFPPEGDEDLEPSEAALVDSELRWIISVPICADDGTPKWVVNVDGKEARRRDEVEGAVSEVSDVVPQIRPFALKA